MTADVKRCSRCEREVGIIQVTTEDSNGCRRLSRRSRPYTHDLSLDDGVGVVCRDKGSCTRARMAKENRA